MRFALGTPDLLKKEVFMSKDKYRLAQERVKLATLVVVLAQQLLKLLSMAFNYSQPKALPWPGSRDGPRSSQ